MKNKLNLRSSILLGGLAILILLLVWMGMPQNESTISPNTESESASSNGQTAIGYQGELSPLVQQKCLTCHATDGQRVERISDIRKTPEGWDATIYRMEHSWGLQITPEEKKQLIKDLSQTNGLAPKEMEPVMYWVTQRGSYMENSPGELFDQTCISCHALGQPLAQRRSPEEWAKLKDFHIAYNPSQLYQMRGVDWDGVSEQILKYLAEKYPLDNPDYTAWKQSGKTLSPAGNWRIVGISPRDGMYSGQASFTGTGDSFVEERKVTINGQEVVHKGQASLYSGFSLRISQDGQERYRGYYNLDESGKKITGSRVMVGDNGLYSDETYYAAEGKKLFDLWPRIAQKGQRSVIHLVGNQLPKQVKLEQISTDPAISVTKVVRQEGDDLWLEVTANQVAEKASISIEGMENELGLRVYDKIDYLTVTPEFGLGRLQYGQYRTSVQFEAIAYQAGPDGKANTSDDVKLGPVPAKWRMQEFMLDGVDDQDIKYIGSLDPKTGVFTPATGGPNQAREWSTNNAGNVTIVAAYEDPGSKKTIYGEAFLLSTAPDLVRRIE